MAMYVTGNLNLFDQRSAKEYGYDSVKHYYEDFLEQWYADVTPEDHIFILGNLSQYSPEAALKLVASLPGTKHLMTGPRDPISPESKKGWMDFPKYAEHFWSVNTHTRRRLLGHDAILSHFGPDGDSWWAPRKTDAFYITAHMDMPEEDDNHPSLPWVSENELSVSWASWSRLVAWEEIKDYFDGKTPA